MGTGGRELLDIYRYIPFCIRLIRKLRISLAESLCAFGRISCMREMSLFHLVHILHVLRALHVFDMPNRRSASNTPRLYKYYVLHSVNSSPSLSSSVVAPLKSPNTSQRCSSNTISNKSPKIDFLVPKRALVA
jgi:hypothetical protein